MEQRVNERVQSKLGPMIAKTEELKKEFERKLDIKEKKQNTWKNKREHK